MEADLDGSLRAPEPSEEYFEPHRRHSVDMLLVKGIRYICVRGQQCRRGRGVCYAPGSISICERTSATPFIPVVSSCAASGRIAGREILGGDLRHDQLAKTEDRRPDGRGGWRIEETSRLKPVIYSWIGIETSPVSWVYL